MTVCVCVCLSVVSHTTGGLSRRCLNTIATIFVSFSKLY